MKDLLQILIVDDHPLVIEGYKSIFNQSNININVTCALTCEDAFKILIAAKKDFDIAIIDWILPPFQAISNGGDFAILAKKYMPFMKLIIITSHEQAFEIYNIKKQINPDGLLIKSDCKGNELIASVDTICKGGFYYSPSVKQCIDQIISKHEYLDNYNRQIINLLAKGVKTKSIPHYLPLSLSAIDKRKAKIKDYLLVGNGTDEDIIREARKSGLI